MSILRRVLKKQFDKIVYNSAFINKVVRNINKLFSPLTSFRVRPYGILPIHFQNGVKMKMATNETSYVTKQLFWRGSANFEYTIIFEELIKHCTCFFDIGANSGYYSVLAAKVNPEIKVYSFEPASGPLHYLNKNIRINNVGKRVYSHSFALSDQKGEVTFYEIINPYVNALHNLSGVGGLKKLHSTQENSIATKVAADTLDNFVDRVNIPTIDLIKIDTEGTENLILQGAGNTIKKYRPVIICETLFKKIEGDLENIMQSHGYLFFNYKDKKLHKTASLLRSVDNGVQDCFFVPPEKVGLITPFIV